MSEDGFGLAVVAIGAALAGFVQGLSGFAFSLVAVGIWAWVLPPSVAAPLTVFGALVGQVLSMGAVRSGYETKRIAPFVVAGLLGVPLGAYILKHSDPTGFKLIAGSLLMIYGGAVLALRDPPKISAGGAALDAGAGFLGGALGGLGGFAGAAPALWTTLRGWPADVKRATLQVFNIAMHVWTLTVYAATTGFDPRAVRLAWVVLPAVLLPGWLGGRLYKRFTEAQYTRFVLMLLVLSGAALALGALRGLWGK